VVAPDPVVGNVHPLLAPGVAGGEGPVGVEERLVEEDVGLLPPDPQPGLVEGAHQPPGIALREPAAEVPGGGGVGDALGPEGVEVDLVVTSDLEVLQGAAAGQGVVGDVQDVVALVARRVPFQQVEAFVDALDQPDPPGQEVDGPDAPGGDGPGPVGQLVVDVGGGQHRLVALDAGSVLQPAEDSPLAAVQPAAADTGVHSRTSWGRRVEGRESPRLSAESRGSLMGGKRW
jgi:hypothetical protein